MRAIIFTATVLLPTGWLWAQGFDLPRLAAAVAVLSLWAVSSSAAPHRTHPWRLILVQAMVFFFLGTAFVFLILPKTALGSGLWLQLSMMAVLAPTVPLVYAFSFTKADNKK